jgi:hypothetical protein
MLCNNEEKYFNVERKLRDKRANLGVNKIGKVWVFDWQAHQAELASKLKGGQR